MNVRLVAAIVCAGVAVFGVRAPSPAAALPPEGPRLAFASMSAFKPSGFRIKVMPPEGGRPATLLRGSKRGVVPTPFFAPSWSNDGVWLVFAGSKGNREGIYKMRADGSGLRFVPGTNGGRSPVLSPDGTKIAFAKDRIGGGFSFFSTTSWLADADGGAVSRLTPWRKNVEFAPSSFSADSRTLALTKIDLRSNMSVALLLRLGGGQRVRLLARRAAEPVFSPDGSQIALVRHKASPHRKDVIVNKDLYVMSADGSGSRALTRTHRIAETRPSWNPSGQRLTFNSFRISKDPIEAFFEELLPFGNSIVQVNADGSCRRKVLSSNAALYGPAWQPGPGRGAGRIEC